MNELDRETTYLTPAKIVPVVGVTFAPGYPLNLHRLGELAGEAAANGERLPVVLIRKPDNPHDRNAIEVHVPALGETAMIGHLGREVAARLAPRIDAGDRFVAQVLWSRVRPDHMDRPGVDIGIARVVERGAERVEIEDHAATAGRGR